MPEQIENRMLVDSEWENNISPIPSVRCDCGRDIPIGEEYWHINWNIYCKECVSEAIEVFLFENRKVVM